MSCFCSILFWGFELFFLLLSELLFLLLFVNCFVFSCCFPSFVSECLFPLSFFFSSCCFSPEFFFFVELCFRVVFPFFPRVVLLSWFQVVVPFKKAKTLFEIVVQFFFF